VRDAVSWLRIAASLAALALIVELGYIALGSPRFAVREVTLRGDPAITRQLAAAIRLPPNTNILRVCKQDIEQQVESFAAVREARVERALPARLLVNVERREALAVLRIPGQAVLIDPDGMPFVVPGESGWGLPELAIVGAAPTDVRSVETRESIAVLLTALKALAPDPRLRPARLQLMDGEDIEVRLQSGPRVRMGSVSQLERTIALLVATLAELGPGRIEYLDLADPRAAFWRQRNAVAPGR
jgi:cell division protein FtsQ